MPCTYQGGKQRVAKQIADALLVAAPSLDSNFLDLCCGSGAVSVELANRGVDPSRITMLDASSWGTFWKAIGEGTFAMDIFDAYLSEIPKDKRLVKTHMANLATQHPGTHEAEIYPVLQSCSFGGKQLWHDGYEWQNAFFRDYWTPTETSVRRSPANPMQPRPEELRRRVLDLTSGMNGIRGFRADISMVLDWTIPADTVIYIDPPYKGTTNYGFGFDVREIVTKLRARTEAAIFVSEGEPLSRDCIQLMVSGGNGGISGRRRSKHRECLSRV